jgi:hypothetical protein
LATYTLPRDHKVTAATMVAIMAVAAIIAFLLISLARTGIAY